ncbi:methyltransferase [Paracoccaceae bacterium]|nr:methyltransferase [Paracoccaceae bacterium]
MFANIKDLTKNKFLGNKLEIFQFPDGYRGNMDSVLVAASVPAESGQKVLELGCGNGVALCCLLHRVSGLEVYGIEFDKRVAELCRRNISLNKFKAKIFNHDIATSIGKLKSLSFDHVFMNPPYFKNNDVKKSPIASLKRAKVETVPLSEWFSVARKRCKPKGKITIIQRVERLPEIIECLSGHFGQITVQPISSFKDASPKKVIVQATKSSSAAFTLLAPKTVHRRDTVSGKVVYQEELNRILRSGHPLLLN